MALGITTDPAYWDDLQWHPTVWSTSALTEGTKCPPAAKTALRALADIVRNPSPVGKNALIAPIFSESSIFGPKGNAASRETSTSASGKEEEHVRVTKAVLANLAKEAGKAQPPRQDKADSPTGAQEVAAGSANVINAQGVPPTAGRNAARNLQKKANRKNTAK